MPMAMGNGLGVSAQSPQIGKAPLFLKNRGADSLVTAKRAVDVMALFGNGPAGR